MAMPSKTIRFSGELHDALAGVAEREDRSFSYVVVRAATAWLEAQKRSPFSVSGKLARQRALESGLPSVDDVLEDRAPVEKEPPGSGARTEVARVSEPPPSGAPSRPAFNRVRSLR